jgi:hypothetical protein
MRSVLLTASVCSVLSFGAAVPDVLARSGGNISGLSGPTGASDPTVGVLPSYNDAYANWKNAGLLSVGGIPNRTTVCATVSPSGVTPPARNDDAAKINAAIASCPAGAVVQLASGTFQLDATESIRLYRPVTLRGTGSCNNGSSPYCSTVLEVVTGTLPTYVDSGACGASPPGTSPCPSRDLNPTVKMGANPGNNLFWSGCAYSVASTGCGSSVALATDASQGQTTIQVAKTSHFSVGMWVRIDEASAATTQTNPANPGGSVAATLFGDPNFASTSGSPAVGKIVYCPGCAGVENGAGYGALYDRETSEIHKVSSIGAGPCPGANCTLTFDDPLTIGYRQSGNHYAQVYFPANQHSALVPFIQEVGIENVTIERSTSGPILMEYCAYCWIRNVEAFGWSGGIVFRNSVRSELINSYIHDCYVCTNSGVEYPIAIDGATTETLVANNIVRFAGKGMVGRACGGGNVVSYNYIDDTFYQAQSIGNYFLDMGINGSHFVGCHHELLEGNWGDNCDDDETHGNVTYHTFFRNWCTLLRTRFNDPSITTSTSSTYNRAKSTVNDQNGEGYSSNQGYRTVPGPLRGGAMMMWDYWMAFVGNVMGISGVTTSANGYVYQSCYGSTGCPNNSKGIWLLGWAGAECQLSTGAYCSDPNLDGTNSPRFFFRSGNYDYYNNAIVDWASGYSQSLPNSFYTATEPSFFGASGAHCVYPWPWVTPRGASQIQTPTGNGCSSKDSLPAKARWDAGTPFVQP